MKGPRGDPGSDEESVMEEITSEESYPMGSGFSESNDEEDTDSSTLVADELPLEDVRIQNTDSVKFFKGRYHGR